jgi:hypothetical protein
LKRGRPLCTLTVSLAPLPFPFSVITIVAAKTTQKCRHLRKTSTVAYCKLHEAGRRNFWHALIKNIRF